MECRHQSFLSNCLLRTRNMTKCTLVSDIAKTYASLGWFSPSIIKAKILLQHVWEAKLRWDDLLPHTIHHEWLLSRSELHILADGDISRCYYLKMLMSLLLISTVSATPLKMPRQVWCISVLRTSAGMCMSSWLSQRPRLFQSSD